MIQVLLKILFTGGLLFVVVICLTEVWRIWLDRRLVLGTFTYTRDGQEVKEEGTQFPLLVKHDLDLVQLINRPYLAKIKALDEAARGGGQGLAAPGKPTRHPSGDQRGRVSLDLPDLPHPPLADVEIQIYGLQVSTILRLLAGWIEQPDEITGTVSEREKTLYVHTEMRGSRATVGDDVWDGDIANKAGKGEASFDLACRIFRLLAAEQVHPVFRKIKDDEFLQFSLALQHFQSFQAAQRAGDSDRAADALQKARASITPLGETSRFPFLYELKYNIDLADKGSAYAPDTLVKRRRGLETYLKLLGENGMAADPDAVTQLASLGKEAASASFVAASLPLYIRGSVRPLQAGVNIGSPKTSGGTLCCLVQTIDNKFCLLSADFVLGDEEAAVGDPVLQPSPALGGTESDKVAVLERLVRPDPTRTNTVGAALAELTSPDLVSSEVEGVGPIADPPASVANGQAVLIVGASGGKVVGEVVDVNASSSISIHEKLFNFSQLIRIERRQGSGPPTLPGDAGAPVLLAGTNQIVGMVYAGDAQSAYAIPIGAITRALRIKSIITAKSMPAGRP